MKISKNPKDYKLFTDREKDIADGNLALITEYSSPMIKLFNVDIKRGGLVLSPKNIGWLFSHIRTLNEKNYDELMTQIKSFIVEKKEKQPKTKKMNNPNKVIQEVDGALCTVDLQTGVAIPITVQKQKAVK
tara:strand:+ start:138 stop:530 length:393 start_codon:yes stop_codon:yes gene_type:complete